MRRVLDASALLVYLEKQSGFEKVIDALSEASDRDEPLLMTTVNWGEVYYVLIKRYGLAKAEEVLKTISALPIDLVSVDLSLAHQAALYKATKKLPYADSFAAALSRLRGATLLTSDKEFEVVSKDIKITWI